MILGNYRPVLCVGVHALILLSLIAKTLEVIIFMGWRLTDYTFCIYTVMQKKLYGLDSVIFI